MMMIEGIKRGITMSARQNSDLFAILKIFKTNGTGLVFELGTLFVLLGGDFLQIRTGKTFPG